MIAEIIETKKTFEPIEIKLVIESEEELCDLWHRVNASQMELIKDFSDCLKYEPSPNGCLPLFSILERYTYELSLRK